MMMRKCTLTILLLSAISIFAQEYCIKRLSIENGLSSNYATNIVQDKKGFIWIATEEGLNRFYGSGVFTYYKKGDQGIISGNELNVLLDDPVEPVIWIGTQRNGLNAFNYQTGETRKFQHDNGNENSICTNDITHLSCAKNNRLWVCTYWEGVDLLNKEDGTFEHFNTKTVKGMPSNQTWCALDDHEGHLYIGQVTNGLTVIDINKRTAQNFMHTDSDPSSISGNIVLCMCRDSNGRIWLGTDRGVDCFDLQTKQFAHYDDNGRMDMRIFDIKEMSDGQIWAATEQSGIAIIDRRYGDVKYRYLTGGDNCRQLSGNSVRNIFEDKSHNVWISIYGSGINFLTTHLPMFTQINHNSSDPLYSLSAKSSLSVCQDAQGRLWVGTDGDGVNLFVDGQRNPSRDASLRRLFSGRSVQAAYCDRQGYLWLGCYNDNAYVMTPTNGKLTKLFDTNEDVRCFYEDNNGNMWICTSRGVYQADMGNKTIKAHYQLGQNLTRTMSIDKRGRRWVGTFGEGIFVCSPKMEIQKILDVRNGLPSNTVNHIISDRSGNIWAGTAEGLVRFDASDRMTIYGWESGLNNIHIRALAEDEAGNIWVSTNKGISCLKDGENSFSNYSTSDNVPLANFNNSCVANLANHSLVFGSTAGLSIFNPEKVTADRKAPQVNIVGIRLYKAEGDSLINLIKDDRLSLKYDENTFSIGLSIENYALYDEVEYSYRMDGLTGDWTTMESSLLTFRNLKPGSYRLYVRCRIRNNKWSELPARLDIYIAPPFWLSWWALSFYLLCAMALLFYIYRSYQNFIHLRNLREQWNRLSHHIEADQVDRSLDPDYRTGQGPVHLIPQELEQKRRILQVSLNELDQQFLSKINHLIEERISSDKIEISYLASGANVSQSTLYRKMKSLTGISSNEYVRKYKMHYAERLLLTGKYTISEVAYMVGMNSQSYFRKCFKEEFNVNPSDYQKRVKADHS